MPPVPLDDAGSGHLLAGRGAAEVLESPRTAGRPGIGERWSGQSRGRRRAIGFPVVLVGGFLLAVAGVGEARGWLVERDLQDAVSLTGRIRIIASSATPAGGRVDYFLAVGNAGSRSVSIREVGIESPRLRVTNRDLRVLALEPGETRSVVLSALLNCMRGQVFDRDAPLEGTVSATPRSGREREVVVTVEQAALLTDAANTLCSIRPDLVDKELSGPILQQ